MTTRPADLDQVAAADARPTDDVHQTGAATELAREQHYLDQLFQRRDALLDGVRRERAELLRADGDSRGSDDRLADASATRLTRRQHELERADQGLCFGRIDRDGGERFYIGRIGLPHEDETADPLLVDWRAPVARSFYTATAAQPLGLRRRRHIRTDQRTVVSIDDEVLDSENPDSTGDLVGEAALMSALGARRTGAMGDIVSTLQAEQDEIIRAPHQGCLVVQGGPGTGKTAVALHRAAYLLFTHTHLVERGVLVVGPSAAFLDYIEQVLPSLGETQVVATTVDRLLPGVTPTGHDSEVLAEIKGRPLWADVLGRVVAERQPVAREIRVSYDGAGVTLTRPVVAEILAQSQAGKPSNHEARQRFRTQVIDALTAELVRQSDKLLTDVEEGLEDILAGLDAGLKRETDLLGPRTSSSGIDVDGVASEEDIKAVRAEILTSRTVMADLDAMWPTLDPEVVLRDLLNDRVALRQPAPELSDGDLQAVLRTVEETSPATTWSTADVPLLDELAELVGAPTAGTAGSPDATASLAERARADRTWAFGHAIVDEAQELSSMQWRMLVRRCPTRSFTVVGDVNQADSPGAATTWEDALRPSFGDRWRRIELTICYRTPQEVMERTTAVLSAAGSTVAPPRSVRSNGVAPTRRTATDATLLGDVAEEARAMAGRYDGGQVAVIVPHDRVSVVEAALAVTTDEPTARTSPAALTVLTPDDAKGLEFDGVLVVDPHAIIEQRRGWNALYVCMTRCTQELGLIALQPGPTELDW